MAASYTIKHCPPGVWTPTYLTKVIRCAYARGENDAGEMTLVLPDGWYDPSLFLPHSRFVVETWQPGQAPYADLDTVWFMVDGPFYDLADDGSEIVTVECQDALGFVLSGHHVAANQYDADAYKLDEADDMCKAVVREQMGTLAADTARDLSAYLGVAADTAAAPIIRLGFERLPVLEALQKIAHASAEAATPTWLGFDVVLANPATGALEFRTYTGQRGADHRSPSGAAGPVVLSAISGTLSRVRSGRAYRGAASVVYAAGESVGDLKPVVSEQDDALIALSPFGRRELYVDTQAPDAATLQWEAKAALRRARPRQFLEARVQENAQALRGVHWNWGDRVTAEHRSETYDARVEKIGVTLEPAQGGGLRDTVEVLIRGESDALK